MKTTIAIVLGLAGLIYALLAVNLVYQDSPESLRWFIVAGVTAVGASVGWLIGFAASLLRGPSRCLKTDRQTNGPV